MSSSSACLPARPRHQPGVPSRRRRATVPFPLAAVSAPPRSNLARALAPSARSAGLGFGSWKKLDPSFFRFSLHLPSGRRRRRSASRPCAPPPPPPSCSPRRPLTHSGDAELRKIRGAALPPYLPALRAGHFPPSLPCSPRGYPRICARVVPCAPSRSTAASDSWRRHALRTRAAITGSRTGKLVCGCVGS